jgi:hypothetical protein
MVSGNVVEVQAVSTTGSPNLLAKKIDGENAGVGLTSGGDLQGIINSETVNLLTPFNVNSFDFTVQNAASTAATPVIGSTITVSNFTTLDATAGNYIIDQQDVDLTNLAVPAIFDRVHIRRAQEVSAIYSAVATPSTPKKLKLKLQTLAGTVGAISTGTVTGQNTFLFTPPADSAFVLLTGQTSLTVVWQPSTSVVAAVPTPGNPLHVRGLLFFDTASGTYFLVADQFTP